jgi:nicotinamidase-related amidase
VEPDGQPLTHRPRPALLVVDMVNDFVSGPFAGPGAAALVERVRAAVDRARALAIPVIHVCDAHAPDDPEFAVMAPHAIAGTPGAEIVGALAPRPGERVVRKRRYSGFFETELDAVLREAGADTLVLAGLQTDCCIRHTAADGFFRGFRIAIASDAVGARTEEGHRGALAEARRLYGAQVDTAAAVLAPASLRG